MEKLKNIYDLFSMDEKNKLVSFVIHGDIKTKARPRVKIINNSYPIIYTPKNTINYENLIKIEYLNQTAGFNFGNRSLDVNIEAYFKAPKNLSRFKKISNSLLIYCPTHKDLDNIAKTILDALNKIAYDDDKQVCSLSISKYYSFGDYEYINITIKEVDNSIEKLKEKYKNKRINDSLIL